jgi:hypothetical protein
MTGGWEPSPTEQKYNHLPGFGLTLNIINATHCGENAHPAAQKRYERYERLCDMFGIDKGENCTCDGQTPYGKLR